MTISMKYKCSPLAAFFGLIFVIFPGVPWWWG